MELQLSVETTQCIGKMTKSFVQKRDKYSVIDHEILGMLRRMARKVAKKFVLRYKSITMMHPNDSEYGTCFGYCDDDRNIVIDVRRGRRYQTFEEVVDTLIHEMAHLGDVRINTEVGNLHDDEWKKRYDRYYYWLKRNLSKQENEHLFCEEIT